jgi:hypothetical protein
MDWHQFHRGDAVRTLYSPALSSYNPDWVIVTVEGRSGGGSAGLQ